MYVKDGNFLICLLYVCRDLTQKIYHLCDKFEIYDCEYITGCKRIEYLHA